MKPSITLASWHVEAMGRISFSTEVGGCTLGMGNTDARLSTDGRNPSHKEALYKSATTGGPARGQTTSKLCFELRRGQECMLP